MAVRKIAALLAVFIVMLAMPSTPMAQSDPFALWLHDVAQEAVADGVSAATVQQALTNISPDEQVIELDQKQPETTITFSEYAERIIKPAKIKKGGELLEKHQALLQEISARYGVPPSVIVALWGMESSFGHNGGDNSVIGSLATLAYQGRRAAFFR